MPTVISFNESQQANDAKKASVVVWLRPHVFAKRSKAVVGYLVFLAAPVIWVLIVAVSAREVARMFEYHDLASVAHSCGVLLFVGALLSLSVQARLSLFMSIGDLLKQRALSEVAALELTTNSSENEALEPLVDSVEGNIKEMGRIPFLVPALFSVRRWTMYTSYGAVLLAGVSTDVRATVLQASILLMNHLSSLLQRRRGSSKFVIDHTFVRQLVEASLFAVVESSGWFISAVAFGFEMDWIAAGSSTFHSVLLVYMIAMAALGTARACAFEAPEAMRTPAIAVAHRLLQRKVALTYRGVVPQTENRRLEDVDGEVKFKNIPIISETRTRFFNCKLAAGEITVVHGGYASERRSMVKRLLKLPGWNKESDGEIFLDDVDVSKLDETWLRHHVTLLEANPVLIQGSVAENIALGCPESSWDDIKRVEGIVDSSRPVLPMRSRTMCSARHHRRGYSTVWTTCWSHVYSFVNRK